MLSVEHGGPFFVKREAKVWAGCSGIMGTFIEHQPAVAYRCAAPTPISTVGEASKKRHKDVLLVSQSLADFQLSANFKLLVDAQHFQLSAAPEIQFVPHFS